MSSAQAQQVTLPAPNGTYNVGRVTLQTTNVNSLQLFNTTPNEAPVLELSVFYPTNNTERVSVPYFSPRVALFEDQDNSTVWKLNPPNGTFERLSMLLAPNGSNITQSSNPWPLLVFGSALNQNRNFYNILVSQVSSSGYVVITYDTPYDTGIVEYSNGSILLGVGNVLNNTNLESAFASATAVNNLHAQDASFIVDQFSNTSFVSSIIPGCDACLNTTYVGMVGHSIGGAAATTATLNDTRVAGALNFDGTPWGDVVSQGLNKPYMLIAQGGNFRNASVLPPYTNRDKMWQNLTSDKFNLVVNNTRHSSFSDSPLIAETLDILPTNDTILAQKLLTRMNGTRASHIVSTYTISFFDWLLKNGSADLIAAPSPLFPEVLLDTNTTSLEDASKGPNGIE